MRRGGGYLLEKRKKKKNTTRRDRNHLKNQYILKWANGSKFRVCVYIRRVCI